MEYLEFEERYARDIQRKLRAVRTEHPDEAATRRAWRISDSRYKAYVIGDVVPSEHNGAMIYKFYVDRQAYFAYAQERGFSLEVK